LESSDSVKNSLREMFFFALVGGLGTLSNLLIFFLGADVLSIHANIMTVVGFAVGVTQNYLLNHYWTFSKKMESAPASFKGFLKFLSVSLIGFTVNLAVLNLALYLWVDIPLKTIAQALGIMAGMGLNFIGSKFFVFRRKNENPSKKD
jgi:putative flippase GtrA